MFRKYKELRISSSFQKIENQMLINENRILERYIKESKEQNDYLEDRLNIIRHELTKEYDMYDIETKMEIITSIIHDYYANF